MAKIRFLADATVEHQLDFIAVLETGRDKFSSQFLSALSAGIDFDWHCLPPRGRSGGILLGVRCDTLQVREVVFGDFAVKFKITSKMDGFRWALVAVYGAAQPELKSEFLADLVRICDKKLPLLIGGDFNIIRWAYEKNNDNFDGRWPFCSILLLRALNCKR